MAEPVDLDFWTEAALLRRTRASTRSCSARAPSARRTPPTNSSRSPSSRRRARCSRPRCVPAPPRLMEADIVQRFLESVGAKADIDLYLRLHRAQRKESFAILAPNAQIVKSRARSAALRPAHPGGAGPGAGGRARAARAQGRRRAGDARGGLADRGRRGLRGDPRRRDRRADAGSNVVAAIRASVARGAIPLVSLEGDKDAADRRRVSACSRRWRRRWRRARSCSSAGGPGFAPNGGPMVSGRQPGDRLRAAAGAGRAAARAGDAAPAGQAGRRGRVRTA